MDASPLVIIGAGGHARVVLDIAKALGRTVTAFVDPERAEEVIDEHPVLKDIGSLSDPGAHEFIIGVGDNFVRSRIAANLSSTIPGIRFATLLHPTATASPLATLGVGAVVMAGSIVGTGAKIGRHCIINTGARLDHDGFLEDYASLAPGVVAGGNVRIGAFTAVSIGVTIKHGITIGQHSVIGAGAVVLRDVPDFTVAYGVPARNIRQRTAGQPYL